VLAWPFHPDLVGKNRFNETDAAESYPTREMVARARDGRGMVECYSPNPFTNRTDLKVNYIVDSPGSRGCFHFIKKCATEK
jgi:signal transduction histidine kinase